MIVSGAAATPRVDVEAVVLCDVLSDGTVAGVALVEPIYDTVSGDRVSTRTVDPMTGAAYVPTGTLQACAPDGCNATTAALILCDVAGDGTATSFVRTTTYDCEGALLATLDRSFDGTAYTVTGTVGVCPTSPDCESATTPVTSVGLCLADGTPIAVTVVRDCTGAVTSEGWINLTTGAWSAGAVPAGTVACGNSQSVQVSGTFCDVLPDGTVAGLVLVEYSYADDGTIASVRLVDATTGATYTPTGTVTTCPTGTEQPEQDLVPLCDVATDGTATAFIRDYRRDELGAISGHSDYTVDGAAYTPTGTVGVCIDPSTPCGDTEIAQLCDLVAGPATPIPVPADAFTLTGNVVVVGDTLQFSRNNVPVTGVAQRDVTGLISGAASSLLFEAGWGGGGSPAATNNAIYQADVLDGATVLATSTVNLSNGSSSAGAVVAQPPLAFTAPASGTVTVRFTDVSTGGAVNRDLVIRPLTVDTDGTSLTALPFLRAYTYDCTGLLLTTTDTTLDGSTAYTPEGKVGVCSGTDGTGTSTDSCAKQVIERCGCDDTTGDGTGDVLYTELWAIDPCGTDDPVLLGAYEDGDPAQPYTPVSPVDCTVEDDTTDTCAKQVIERCGCDDTTGDGTGDVLYTELWAIDPCGTDAPALLGTYLDGDLTQPYTPTAPVECTVEEDEDPSPLSTGVRAVTGTAAQNLVTAFPGLQSVSLTVLAGTVNVTMSNGAAVPIPAGVTMTWSVTKDEDSALATATFTGAAAGSQYLLNYTYR